MELEGTVTNVTNFGAFVDFGVHQDGLVHISELSHKYVQDARQAVKVGDIVKVKVIGVDSAMKRISLSMKAVMPKPPRRRRPRKKPKAAAATVAAPQLQAVPASTEKPPAPPKPFPIPLPQAKRPRPEQPPRKDRPAHPQQMRPPKPPVETVPPPKQTMEEKIRMLQEKFGRAR
jgi:protein Tex